MSKIWTKEERAAYMREYSKRPYVIAKKEAQKLLNPKLYEEKERRNHLKYTYGISLEKYNELFHKQAGCCAICLKDKPGKYRQGLFVDHDHKTGVIRGLLCNNCNSALGMFEENLDILKAAIKYLEKPA